MANWRKNVLFEKSPTKGGAVPHAQVLFNNLVIRIQTEATLPIQAWKVKAKRLPLQSGRRNVFRVKLFFGGLPTWDIDDSKVMSTTIYA